MPQVDISLISLVIQTSAIFLTFSYVGFVIILHLLINVSKFPFKQINRVQLLINIFSYKFKYSNKFIFLQNLKIL